MASPNQADDGAQLFWLHCQPCHGDRGQGLTDEWRAQYPPEDQNCWNAGCHGKRPYENGFTLPTTVPALLGPQTLTRFETAADLHAFISAAMPFQAPASLQSDEYWALTAFLLRGHSLPDSALPIQDQEQAARIRLVALGSNTEARAPSVAGGITDWPLAGAGLAGLGCVLAVLTFVVRRRRRAGS